MKQKIYVVFIYLGALLLSLSGCSSYYKSNLEVGQCFMRYSDDSSTVEIVEKREFGVNVKIYESGVFKGNGYLLYNEFERLIQRDCHKEVK